MTEKPNTTTDLRTLSLSGPLRSHFGPIIRCEPSILFRPDGTVQVSGGGQVYELTQAEAEAIAYVR